MSKEKDRVMELMAEALRLMANSRIHPLQDTAWFVSVSKEALAQYEKINED